MLYYLHVFDDDVRGGHPTPDSTPHTHTHNPGGRRPGPRLSTYITSSFCLLPLATANNGSGLLYGLRLAFCIIPTALLFVFVNRFVISMPWVGFLIRHFTSSTLYFCRQPWPRSTAPRVVCVCGGCYQVWGAPPVHHHHVMHIGILGLCFVISYLVIVTGVSPLFSISGLPLHLVQKTRLTSSLHFFK